MCRGIAGATPVVPLWLWLLLLCSFLLCAVAVAEVVAVVASEEAGAMVTSLHWSNIQFTKTDRRISSKKTL